MLLSLLTFSAAAALIVLLPGPDTLVVLRSLMRSGRRAAVRTVAGVLTGLVLWAVAAALGLSAVLRASSDGYLVLRVVGGVYLVLLGVQAFRTRTEPAEMGVGSPGSATGLLGTGYRAGLATDVLNPKVGVFFVTFLPQFIPHHAPVSAYTLLLGAVYIAGTAAWFALLVRLAARLGRWLRRPATQRWMQRITGVALLGFAVGMVAESA
jgi:threonine/homoserine/homoserine lactone efflux protein